MKRGKYDMKSWEGTCKSPLSFHENILSKHSFYNVKVSYHVSSPSYLPIYGSFTLSPARVA